MRTDIVALRMNNDQLLQTLKDLASEEKRIQSQFLGYLAEVDSRRLYAVEGYPSLFAFLTGYLGYSES